jgi:hypothetical protein
MHIEPKPSSIPSRQQRRKFIQPALYIFGPGFLNMAEYHFMKNNGHNRFAILLSEPSIGYDWGRS